MSIIFYSNDESADIVLKGLQATLPQHQLHRFADSHSEQRRAAKYAVAWNPPEAFFDDLASVQVVFSVAAGVDHLLNHPGLPARVRIARLENAGMSEKMAEYVLYGVLHYQRSMDVYNRQQHQQVWDDSDRDRHAENTHIGILGMGAMGSIVGKRLLTNGYKVSGWSRQAKEIPGISMTHGRESLHQFVQTLDVLVCLLPLTSETEQIIDAQLLTVLKKGAYLINAARGRHVDTEALIAALHSGQLRGALLDVTDPEPLSDGHPLWTAPNVIITPHIAAPTQIHQAIQQIADNIKRADAGEALTGLVSQAGY